MSYKPSNPNGQASMANSEPVVIASDQTAIPVSVSSSPLPSGASTAAKQDTGNASLASIDGKITAVNTGSVTVVSSVLPTGASTSAKQPALGTAGTPSADVLTVQGSASMTAIKTDGSGVTQPVSAASLPLPTGAATSALQTQPGVDIGDVTINNATGASAVNIQDGGNSITIDQSTASNLNAQVTGLVASGAADSDNNVVKVGTKYNATQPTFTDGQRAEYQVDARGSQRTAMMFAGTATALVGLDDNSNGVAASATANKAGVISRNTIWFNSNSTHERQRQVENGTSSVGTGIAASGILAQFDDVSPTAITENQFGNVRISANRNLYNTIRDAAGNERGVNVSAGNALLVDASATTQPVVGNVASGSSDSGNPVKVGGRYNSTRPVLTDGQRGDVQLDNRGNIGTALFTGTTAASFGADSTDGVSTSGTADKMRVINLPYTFNGTTWDRAKSDGTTGGHGVGGTVASAATDSGNPVKIGGKFNSSLPTFTDGQRGDFQMSSRGALFVNLKDGANSITGATAGADGGANSRSGLYVYNLASLYNGTTLDMQRSAGVTGSASVGGSTASGATLAANPLTGGGLAKTANPTAVTDGQVVNSLHDKVGKQVVVGSLRDLKADAMITLTTTTETSLIAAVASTFNDIYGAIFTNTSATASEVVIRDDTAGTVRFSIMVPAGETRGFMLPESAALKQAVVNKPWTAQLGTAVSSMKITALYVKNI